MTRYRNLSFYSARKHGFGIGLLCAVSILAVAPVAPAQDSARMEKAIRIHVDQGTFMGAALVARGDQVLFNKGFGSANLEWDLPNTPATKFRLGSLTKQFTAVSILLLEERGKLKLTDTVAQHLPDAPEAWKGITMFHLLTHTSGIPNFTSFPEINTFKLSATPTEKVVAFFRNKPLDFPPGDRYSYSNSGFVLLGYLLEQISGQSYESFVREHLFAPLGMNDSGYDSRSILRNRASGYARGPDGLVNAPFIDMSIPHAAGALYSTTADLLRWTQGLYGGRLLSPDSLQKFTTPNKNDYALGLGIGSDVKGRKFYGHSGGIEGFNTRLMYYPETRVTVAVLANVNGPDADSIARDLGALAHGDDILLGSEHADVPVSAERLAKLAGVYELSPTARLRLTVVDGRLLAQLGPAPRLPEPLNAESDTRFFSGSSGVTIVVEQDANGAVTGLVINRSGREQRARRLAEK